MFKKIILLTVFCLVVATSSLDALGNDLKKTSYYSIWDAYPLYVGISLGYGSTDWSQLVATGTEDDMILLTTSAPIAAKDRGFLYGFVLGYEVQPFFAFEINYTRFPNSTIYFDEYNTYSFRYGLTSPMRSFTYTYNFLGKFMVQLGKSGFRAFANAGAAVIHRHDFLVDGCHVNPTFGVGLNRVFKKRLMLELGFQYYAGFGKAVFTPAINYVPFLYALTLKLAYRF